MKFFTFTISFFLLFQAYSESYPTKNVQANKISSQIKIDGILDEAVWQGEFTINNFIQFHPDNGALPEAQTQTQFYYDDLGIYFAAKCYESNPDNIAKGVDARDSGPGNHADLINFLISPYNDDHNYVYFMVSPANVQSDCVMAGNNMDFSWSAVWYSETAIVDDGWTCEVYIPYAALRFSKEKVQDWGLNVWRWRSKSQEWSSWNYVSNVNNAWFKSDGEIKNLKDLNPPVRLSLSPYISGYIHKQTGEHPEYSYNLGMDLKYGISQSFTLDMTLIPDFGQVKSDDVVLNLSPYEQYFNENRQFFTEGMDLFNKGEIFYSRRIGAQPQKYYEVEDSLKSHEQIIENPNAAALINSTKISGRTSGGLGVGFLNSMTQKAFASIQDTLSGESRRFKTQPFTNYNVLVVDQTLFSRSYISLINTNFYNNAYVGNVLATEFNFVDSSNIYGIKGIGGYSYLGNGHTDQGFKTSIEGGKIGGRFQAEYQLALIDDKYDQNDLGFMRNNNQVSNAAEFSYNQNTPFSFFLNMRNAMRFMSNRMYNPNAYSEFLISYEIHAEFTNRYAFNMHAMWAPTEKHDYYETRTDGRYVKMNKWYHNCASVNTDASKMISGRLHAGFSKSYDYFSDVFSYNWSANVTLRPSKKLNIEVSMHASGENNKPGYIEPDFDSEELFFGIRDRETIVNNLNTSYTFSNTMSLDFRIRHYWSKAIYTPEFYVLQHDGSLKISDYSAMHDINYNAFNIDMSYRWYFAPGSELVINWKNSIVSDEMLDYNHYWNNTENLLNLDQLNSISFRLLYYLDYNSIKSTVKKSKS